MVVQKALRVLTSWLNGAGIEHRVKPDSGEVVLVRGDQEVFCRVVDKEEGSLQDGEVSGRALLDSDSGLSSFSAFVSKLGYNNVSPVNRGETEKENYSYKDDFDLVVMRHRELRAAPNPSPEDLKKYQPVSLVAARKFFNANLATCKRNGYEIEDLQQYGLLWTVNFLHKYRLLSDSGTENERLLMAHLKQRYVEFFKLLAKREKNTVPSLETLRVALYEENSSEGGMDNVSTAYTTTSKEEEAGSAAPLFFEPAREYVEEEFQPIVGEVDTSTTASRKRTAKTVLENSLNALDKDTRIQKLMEVADSEFVNNDARRVARRYLRANGVSLGGLEEEEDVPGVDTSSS